MSPPAATAPSSHARTLPATTLLALSLAAASICRAQQAYISATGSFSASNAVESFVLSLPAPVSSADNLFFRTFGHSGGTNAAAETISAGGFDPILTLFDNGGFIRGTNDDGFSPPNRDSNLTWTSITLNPLPAATYHLDLTAYASAYPGGASPWAVDLVGPADRLLLTNPSATSSSLSTLRFGTTGAGTTPAQVNLASSTVSVNGPLEVAHSGYGLLSADAARLYSADAYVGTNASSKGTLNLTNNAAWLPDAAYLGYHGWGLLNVSSASAADIYGNAYLAYFSDGRGDMTVSGASSQSTVRGDLEVGDGGTGTLTISAAAHVDSTFVGTSSRDVIGDDGSSNGAATITGLNSWWHADTLAVGNYGTASLTVSSGAQLQSLTTYLAKNAGSSATATVTGSSGSTPSSWSVTGPLYLAGRETYGPGGSAHLTVSSGAAMSVSGPTLIYGGGRADVTGAGSSWQTADLTIGASSGTAQVNLTARGTINSASVLVGTSTGSGTLAVDGYASLSPSNWNVTGDLTVGSAGLGSGLAVVQNHGLLNVSGTLTLLGSPDATGTLTVQSGAHLTASTLLHIANHGTLNLTGFNSRVTTGHFTSAAGGSFNWNGGTLEVTSNGLWIDTTATDNPFAGSLTLDSGETLIVSLPLADNFPQNFCVGARGVGTMTVQGGAAVQSFRTIVGGYGVGNGTVTVDGSTWTCTNALNIGHQNTAVGIVTVRNGSVLSSPWIGIAGYDSANGTLIIDNSTATTTQHLDVADAPTGSGKLTVRNNAQLTVGTNLATHPHGTTELLGGSITAHSFIVDTGGTFTHTDGTLTVDGGTFTMESGHLTIDGAPSPGTPTIRLQNSAVGSVQVPPGMTDEGVIEVARSGRGRLEILSGSVLTAGTCQVAFGSTTPGTGQGYVLVQGAGSRLQLTGDAGAVGHRWVPLLVGYNGAGTVDILDQGQVLAAGPVTIGTPDWWNSNGIAGPGVIRVDGQQSLLRVTDGGIDIGALSGGQPSSSGGFLHVANNGHVEVEQGVKIITSGTLSLGSSGAVTAGSFSNVAGTFTHNDGTLTVDGGTFDPGPANYILDGSTAADLPTVILTNGASASLQGNTTTVGLIRRGSLQILSGSTLNLPSPNSVLYLGSTATANGELIVDGAGSSLTSTFGLVIGQFGTGTARVRNGASISDSYSPSELIGIANASHGTLEVTGTASGTGTPSTYTTHGLIQIGQQGLGTLSISAGGHVDALAGALIAAYPSAAGSAATVTGSGSQLTITGNLAVGGSSTGPGGAASLTASSSGRVSSDSLTIWTGSSATVSGGQLLSSSALNDGALNLTAGSASLGPLTGSGSCALSGGTLTATSVVQQSVSLTLTGKLAIPPHASPPTLSILHQLTIAPTATFDLADNDLILDYTGPSPYATILSYLSAASHNDLWDRPGLTSSSAAAHLAHSLGILDTHSYNPGSLDGTPVDSTSILVKYTYDGDANLDGKLDPDDFALLDRGYACHLTGWTNGDFNYDSSVTPADYFLLDRAYLSTYRAPISTTFLATRESQFGPAYIAQLIASVPEPSAAGLVAGLAFMAHGRRQRKSVPF